MPGISFLNLFKWKSDETFDERFIMHRFKSTRLAVLAGTIMIFVFFTYHVVIDKTIRWDLFGVTATMAVVKMCSMLYYRKTN